MRDKILFCLLVWLTMMVIGCDNINCHPEGKRENKKWDWYLGVKCESDF